MTTKSKAFIGVAVAALLVVGGAVFWFLRDDAPDKVDLDAAARSVTTSTAKPGDPATTAGSGSSATDGIDGTWKIDTTTGEFDFESATGTFAGFRIKEELASIGSTTAVGRTNAVTVSPQASSICGQVSIASMEPIRARSGTRRWPSLPCLGPCCQPPRALPLWTWSTPWSRGSRPPWSRR